MNKVFYPELEFRLSHFGAVGLGAGPFISLNLSFIICKMGLTFCIMRLWNRLTEQWHGVVQAAWSLVKS